MLRETVYDGEVPLRGADLFYVHETYTVHVAATIRTEAASEDFTVYADGSVVSVPIARPARRVEVFFDSEKLTASKAEQTRVAREKITRFLVDHDIYFNGAAEDATLHSALGVAQV